MHDFPDLIEKELIDRAGKLSTALLCDGMRELGAAKSYCLDATIKPICPSMKVVGTAATVETNDGDNFPIHVATYAVPQDGYVMVVDGKGFKDRCYMGDLIMGAAQAAGYLGAVIDGYTRDRDGNIGLGFPVFSRGLMPAGPTKKGPGKINEPIVCGGVEITPGDLVVGDCDGVCIVPRRHLEQVLEKAEKKLAYEQERGKAIEAYRKAKVSGAPLPQLAPQWVLDMIIK